MRRYLKNVRPDVVHEVSERVLTTKAVDPECHVFHCPAGCLSVNKVPGRGGERNKGKEEGERMIILKEGGTVILGWKEGREGEGGEWEGRHKS